MPSRYDPLPFSPGYDFRSVRQGLTINGRVYAAGEQIDKTGLSTGLLEKLYRQRRITPITPSAPPVPAKTATLKPQAPKTPNVLQQPDPVSEGAAEPGSEPAATTAPPGAPPASTETGITIEHRGFGRYFALDAAGNEIGGPFTKAEAEEIRAGKRALPAADAPAPQPAAE